MSVNKSIEETYGMSKTEIENQWRKSIGASTIQETKNQNKPKSTTSSVQLYTLDDMKNNSEKISKEKSEPKDVNLNSDQKNNRAGNSCGLSDSNEILILFYFFGIGMLYKKRK